MKELTKTLKKKPESLELSEAEIQKQILDFLEISGFFVWRNNTGAVKVPGIKEDRFIRYGQKGSADILGVLPGGKLLALEVKKKGGVISADQEKWLSTVNRFGGVAFVAYSLEGVKNYLKGKGYL